jgi:hypothetical protein
MMRRVLPVITFLAMFTFVSDAGIFASRMLYERHHGMGCSDVTHQSVYQGFPEASANYQPHTDQCTVHDNPLFNNGIQQQALNLSNIGREPRDMLRDQVFHHAALRKRDWDLCMEDVFDALETNTNFRRDWALTSMRAFFNLKKTQAYENACKEKFWYAIDPSLCTLMEANPEYANTPRDQREERCWEFQYDNPNGNYNYDWSDHFDTREEMNALKEICYDPEQRRAMAIAPYIFERSVPFFNSADVFEVWERNLDMFFDTRNNGPITDEALMSMDFSPPEGLDEIGGPEDWLQRVTPDLNTVFQRARRAGQQDRQTLERMIARADPNDHRDLVRFNPAINPDEYFLQETLYEQGYYAQILEERGYIERDALGGSSRMTPEAVCMMGPYHESLGGELAEMAILGVATAGVGTGVQIVRGGVAAARGLATMRGLMSVGAMAAVGGLAPTALQMLHDACDGRSRETIRVTSDQHFNETMARGMFPPGVDAQRLALPHQVQNAPSCRGLELQTQIEQSLNERHCALEVGMNFGPNLVVIPAEIGIEVLRPRPAQGLDGSPDGSE